MKRLTICFLVLWGVACAVLLAADKTTIDNTAAQMRVTPAWDKIVNLNLPTGCTTIDVSQCKALVYVSTMLTDYPPGIPGLKHLIARDLPVLDAIDLYGNPVPIEQMTIRNCPSLAHIWSFRAHFGSLPINDWLSPALLDIGMSWMEVPVTNVAVSAVYLDGISIGLDNNGMSTNVVDQLLVDLDGTGVTGGFLYIPDNSAPGAAGLAAITSLESKSWTVIYDGM